MRKTIAIALILMFLLCSCATKAQPRARVPEVPSTMHIQEKLIDEPRTASDLMNNLLVLEYMYAQEKHSNLSLLIYLAQLAGDKDKEAELQARRAELESIYGITE